MPTEQFGSGWKVDWATPTPNGDEYLDNLVLSREQAVEYGDELVSALRIDGEILREWGLDPREPFAWKIDDAEVCVKQISRQAFEDVAESDRPDASYAREVLYYRAKRRVSSLE